MSANFRQFDLNLLRIFDAVMDEGSLTRAAEKLATTQPAVSQAVRRLHDAVGEPLFTRTAHGMRPTVRALQLWPQVREALLALRSAIAPADFDPARDAVEFCVAMADATATLLAPGLVQALVRTAAAASIRVLPLATRDPRHLLEAGDADAAIGYFPDVMRALATEGSASLWRQARLYETRHVCVMRHGHPLARSESLTLDDYCDAHHLLVSFSGRPQGIVDQALAALGRRRRVVFTVNQFHAAGRVLAQSDLLAALPLRFIEATGVPGELVRRELPIDLGPMGVDMLWHRRHDADPARAWLRAQVQGAVEP